MSCNACDSSGCTGVMNPTMLLHKIDSMISDNYTLLIVLLVIIGVVGLALWYFTKSLTTTIKTYLKNKPPKEQSSGDNPRLAEDDDNQYYDKPTDDPQYVDPNEYMPKDQKEYVKNIESTFDEFNKLKTDYIKKTYNRDNDDYIDKSVLYEDNDNYVYNMDDDA